MAEEALQSSLAARDSSPTDVCRWTVASLVRRRLRLHLLLLLLLVAASDRARGSSITDYVYGKCNTNTYQRNSTFAQNLNTVIGILTQRAAAGATYFLTNTTGNTDNSTWVYGAYQCRGDLTPQDCKTCVETVTGYGCTNGNAIGMRVQLLGCFYRYENYGFANPDFTVVDSNCSSQQNVSLVYQSDLNAALKSSSTEAPANNGFAYATIGSAHSLSQCFGYVSTSDCATCLSQSFSRSTICNTSSSGFFYYVSCYYLFSDTVLLFPTSTSSPPSASSPPPSNSPPLVVVPPAISPSPADLLLPLPPPIGIPPPSPAPNSRNITAAAIVGISVGSALAVIVTGIFCVVYAMRRRRSVQRTDEDINPMRGSNFTIEELQAATEGFHSRNVIGQGGFGVVYKGTLRNGDEVAIKTISSSPNTATGFDFMNEARLISTVQHRNLIKLLGWATDDSRWYLVYEFLPNRSLDLHLFVDDNNHEAHGALDWKTRFNIITGIARGLCYLHEDSHVRIVHRDIKASNILLDGDMNPKIADFGLARLFADDVSHLTTAVAGTLGYVAPEYAMGGRLSEKVDVYSFGLLMLEIVSGRRVIENDAPQTHILDWAWGLYQMKKSVAMIDRRIRGEVNEWEATRVVHVALLCAQTRPQERPSMSQVYMMLRSQSAILNLPSRPQSMSMGIFPSPYHDDLQERHSSNSRTASTNSTSPIPSSRSTAVSSQQTVSSSSSNSRNVIAPAPAPKTYTHDWKSDIHAR